MQKRIAVPRTFTGVLVPYEERNVYLSMKSWPSWSYQIKNPPDGIRVVDERVPSAVSQQYGYDLGHIVYEFDDTKWVVSQPMEKAGYVAE